MAVITIIVLIKSDCSNNSDYNDKDYTYNDCDDNGNDDYDNHSGDDNAMIKKARMTLKPSPPLPPLPSDAATANALTA